MASPGPISRERRQVGLRTQARGARYRHASLGHGQQIAYHHLTLDVRVAVELLGYVDDVLLLPTLIWLPIRLLPPPVIAECRGKADDWLRTRGAKPTSRLGAVLVVLLWVGATALAIAWWLRPRP